MIREEGALCSQQSTSEKPELTYAESWTSVGLRQKMCRNTLDLVVCRVCTVGPMAANVRISVLWGRCVTVFSFSERLNKNDRIVEYC